MARRRSRRGTTKIQYVPTDRFVKVSLDNLSVAGKKVFVAWRHDIHNGIPEDGYVLVPQTLQKHIILSLKDNGCGWIEANQPKEKTVEFKLRFNVSPFYPEEKETKGVKVKFELYEPNKNEPVSDAELDVFLQCNKSMNKALKGTLDPLNMSSSLSASNASGIKEEFCFEPNFRGSCEGTVINITSTPAPIDFKMSKFEQPISGSKHRIDFADDRISKKAHVDSAPDQLFHENTEAKNPLRLSISLDYSGWLYGPIPELALEAETRKITSTLTNTLMDASCSLPFSCVSGI